MKELTCGGVACGLAIYISDVDIWVDGSQWVVDGSHVHREAEHEDEENDKEATQVHHQLADDDCPGPEEVMERQEVQKLHWRQQQCDGQQVVSGGQ